MGYLLDALLAELKVVQRAALKGMKRVVQSVVWMAQSRERQSVNCEVVP